MTLPKELSNDFDDEMEQFEEETRMPYVTHIERRGIERGLEQGLQTSVLDNLETRFGTVSEPLAGRIRKIGDTELLRKLHRRAILVASPLEFEQELEAVSA